MARKFNDPLWRSLRRKAASNKKKHLPRSFSMTLDVESDVSGAFLSYECEIHASYDVDPGQAGSGPTLDNAGGEPAYPSSIEIYDVTLVRALNDAGEDLATVNPGEYARLAEDVREQSEEDGNHLHASLQQALAEKHAEDLSNDQAGAEEHHDAVREEASADDSSGPGGGSSSNTRDPNNGDPTRASSRLWLSATEEAVDEGKLAAAFDSWWSGLHESQKWAEISDMAKNWVGGADFLNADEIAPRVKAWYMEHKILEPQELRNHYNMAVDGMDPKHPFNEVPERGSALVVVDAIVREDKTASQTYEGELSEIELEEGSYYTLGFTATYDVTSASPATWGYSGGEPAEAAGVEWGTPELTALSRYDEAAAQYVPLTLEANAQEWSAAQAELGRQFQANSPAVQQAEQEILESGGPDEE